ncbi:hypothetical protein BC830DRAFT_642836 [Chytriomyces sp. MP71]|nr:hypothetical protein BC830DRAFT_642836 [Chytriomyces sp. MP71]
MNGWGGWLTSIIHLHNIIEPVKTKQKRSPPKEVPFPEYSGNEEVAASSEDDLGGPINSNKRGSASTREPVPTAEDEFSDFCPSDDDAARAITTEQSRARRIARGEITVDKMRDHFKCIMPTASRNLFHGPTGSPFSVHAILKKASDSEDANTFRWSNKGPVVLMFLPCSEDRPWEARLVAHYTFGTQSAAINLPSKRLL